MHLIFVFYVRDYLARKYGDESLAERGLKVVTTLDWELQEKAEEIIKRHALENEIDHNASNAALVAADPKTGEMLVMVGSRDYFDEEIDGNFNVSIAERQPGSSFKPFIYASAFEKGYTPETVIFDLKTQFSASCEPSNLSSENGCYAPSNHSHNYIGPMSLRNALAQSVNIPAVKLLYMVGVEKAIKLARDMGITTLDENGDRYGLTLVLGGGEVRLVDMVSAYGVFANQGEKVDQNIILRIEDTNGEIIEEANPSSHRVLDKQATLQIADVLSDDVARSPLWGSRSALYFSGKDVAAKSGTTNDFRDAWLVGFTSNLAVGVWAGNNDNRSMNGLSGLIVTPMWREFMDVALPTRDQESFEEPLATPTNVKHIFRGLWFDPETLLIETNNEDASSTPQISLGNTISNAHSILFFVDRNDPTGPAPSNPEADSQFPLWEYPVSVWKSDLLGALNPQQEIGESNTEEFVEGE